MWLQFQIGTFGAKTFHMHMKLTFDLYSYVIIEMDTLGNILIDTEISPIALINTEIFEKLI